jgi:replicative DNA helicase
MSIKHYIKKYHTQLPPQHNLVEEILLGGILIKPNILILTITELDIEYFAIETHQLIYRTILQIYAEYKYVDPIVLINTLWEKNLLHEAGGMQKILNLIKQAQIFISISCNNIAIQYYIDMIKNKYFRRLLIQYGYYIIKLAHLTYISNNNIANKADKYLNQLENLLEKQYTEGIKTLVTNFLINLKAQNTIIDKKNLLTGFQEIDKITGGFKNSDLIIIAGRPSMGKTSFILSIIRNMITSTKIRVGIFSLETSKQQILYKLLSITSHISLQKLISGNINEQEWIKIQKMSTNVIKSISYIDDTANLSIYSLNSKAKLLVNDDSTVNLIIVDYLQLIQSQEGHFASRTEELATITRILKALARDLHIPIIVLSQLNRNVENRINKKPLLSDLKESGCIGFNNTLVTNHENNLYFSTPQLTIKHKLTFLEQNSFPVSNVKYKILSQIKQYIYDIYSNNYRIIYLTHNHSLLCRIGWLKNDNLKYFYLIQSPKKIDNKFIPVKEICYKIKQAVYDIEIYDYTSFYTNDDLIVHNSIEQDADLVLLLYREAYYNQGANNITDIIIAKHRNGPTGTAQLHFNTYLAAFENKFE